MTGKGTETRITRALSVDNVLNAKFNGIALDGNWGEVIGMPEVGKSWLAWGQSGSGKTTFLMQLAKQLSKHVTVIYNSLEEWPSPSVQRAYKRAGITRGDQVLMLSENMKDFQRRMLRQRSPAVMFIDSTKYTRMRWEDYLEFCALFDHKLKIWVSHAAGKEPKGALAEDIRYDSFVKIYTEGFRAFVTSRYSDNGGGSIDIWPEGAANYWGEAIK